MSSGEPETSAEKLMDRDSISHFLHKKTRLYLLPKDIRVLLPAGVGILAYGLLTHLLFDRFCPMLILTDFPCPGCGMTRALFLALTGRFALAWKLQPLIYGWILYGMAFVIRRYFTQKAATLREKRLWLLAPVILLSAGIVLYLYRIIHGFPPGLKEPGRTLPGMILELFRK